MAAITIIKKGLSEILSNCRLFSVFEHYRLADKAFVLMYHRVLSQERSYDMYVQPGMYVTDKTLDRQVSFLKEKYKVLFLEELIKKINRNESICGCCAITFDDGWRDNYTDAFPILKKHQIPATIFLATDNIGTDRLFWPEEICQYIDKLPLLKYTPADNAITVLKFYRDIEKYSTGGRNSYLNKVIEVLKKYSPDERAEVLTYFRGMNRAQVHLRQMMDWKEAEEMLKSGLIVFGAHTARHEILDQLPISIAKTEIYKSKYVIEQSLGVKVTTFAYPNGNYNADVLTLLQEGDFAGAVTTKRGYLKQSTSLMEIPRIGMHEDISDTYALFHGRILLEMF